MFNRWLGYTAEINCYDEYQALKLKVKMALLLEQHNKEVVLIEVVGVEVIVNSYKNYSCSHQLKMLL